MRRSTISSLAITAFLTIGAASAAHDQQAKAIYTASQFGAYHSSFCPPILVILESAGFHGYSCKHARHAPISQIASRSVYAASLFLQLRQLLFETADPIGEIVIGRTVHRLG